MNVDSETLNRLRLSAIERAACTVADHWRRHRVHRPELVDKTDPAFVKALEALDKLLVGNTIRCCCLQKGKRGPHDHAVQCPAYQPSCKKDCPCRGTEPAFDVTQGFARRLDDEGWVNAFTGAPVADDDPMFSDHPASARAEKTKKTKTKKTKTKSTEPPTKGQALKTKGSRFVVRGDTYTHKETLKKLGAGWEAVLRAWIFVDPKPSVVKRVEALGLQMEEI